MTKACNCAVVSVRHHLKKIAIFSQIAAMAGGCAAKQASPAFGLQPATTGSMQWGDGTEQCRAQLDSGLEHENDVFSRAFSRKIIGTAGSVPLIVPTGIAEMVFRLPVVIGSELLFCSPALVLDIGMKSGGGLTQLCLAAVPAIFPMQDLTITNALVSETRNWRRMDIEEIVVSRSASSQCFSKIGDAVSLETAYAVLENLILDDRYYKTLTPVQLDEIDSHLRQLKTRIQTKKSTIPKAASTRGFAVERQMKDL